MRPAPFAYLLTDPALARGSRPRVWSVRSGEAAPTALAPEGTLRSTRSGRPPWEGSGSSPSRCVRCDGIREAGRCAWSTRSRSTCGGTDPSTRSPGRAVSPVEPPRAGARPSHRRRGGTRVSAPKLAGGGGPAACRPLASLARARRDASGPLPDRRGRPRGRGFPAGSVDPASIRLFRATPGTYPRAWTSTWVPTRSGSARSR